MTRPVPPPLPSTCPCSDAGSDAGGLRATAVEQPDGSWVLSGTKVMITNAGFATVFAAFARTPDPERPDLPQVVGAAGRGEAGPLGLDAAQDGARTCVGLEGLRLDGPGHAGRANSTGSGVGCARRHE